MISVQVLSVIAASKLIAKESSIMENKQYGTTWLSIYTVLFVLRMISLTITIISSIVMCARYGLFTNSLAMFVLIVLILEYAFEGFALYHFLKRTSLGYTLNMINLIVTVLMSAFNVYIQHLLADDYDPSMLPAILLATAGLLVIWGVPNYIYFKHRKFLFGGNLKEKKSTSNNASSLNQINTTAVADEKEPPETEENSSLPDASSEHEQKEASTPTENPKKAADVCSGIPVRELKLLKELHESGVLSDDEFEQKKKQLLGI